MHVLVEQSSVLGGVESSFSEKIKSDVPHGALHLHVEHLARNKYFYYVAISDVRLFPRACTKAGN